VAIEFANKVTKVALVGRIKVFNSLDEEIKRDDQATSTSQERWLRYMAVVLVSVVLFGGLCAGIRFLE
jgi:hypothetical protein